MVTLSLVLSLDQARYAVGKKKKKRKEAQYAGKQPAECKPFFLTHAFSD